MSRFPLGAPVRVTWRTYQPDLSTLVNATANSLTVKLASADGTQAPTAGSPYVSPVNDSTGLYHQDVPSSDLGTAGHYQWVNTSTGTGAGAAFGEFDVFDPFETSVLPLADAKDALNIPQATTGSDSEIAQYVATITSSIQSMTGGPLVNTSITERAEMQSGQTVLLVRQRPLVSVTSIVSVASGTAIDISAGLDVDANTGTIRRKLAYPFYGPFFAWLPVVLITYVAGWGTSVPAAFGVASRIILQNLWETQHGPSARPSMAGGDDLVTLPGWGFAIPNQAAELLEGSLNGMSFMYEAYV
jgi:hypothetical protein